MASVTSEPNGRKSIQFVAGDGKRKTLRIGKATKKQAEAFKLKVESLIAAGITGSMDNETAKWLAGQDKRMRSRISAVGLETGQERVNVTLGTLLDDFFADLSVKGGTETTYKQTRTSLETFFGKDRALRTTDGKDTIRSKQADEWRQSMKAEKLADATISKRVKTARQIFKRAIRWEMVTANPLEGVKAGSQANDDRQRYISREDSQKVLDACPDAEWRLIFALSRYGGLRCPSEHLGLRWIDIDWNGKLLVHSPKTEHQGKATRTVPMFPELRKYLTEALEAAPEGAVYVIHSYRDSTTNLRTRFERIIRKAGLDPWPRLFHNLRATRQTELSDKYPAHVVCKWLGNSKAVAEDHYLQTTDAHFARASADDSGKAVQNAAHQPDMKADEVEKEKSAGSEMPREFAAVGSDHSPPSDETMTPTGFEPVSRP
jgi:integrase